MGAPEKTYTQAQLDLAVQAAVEKAVNAKVKELDAQHHKALEEKDMDFALRGALTDAHDAALVMGLLDRSKLKLENGKIKGLDEQLGELRKSKSFLFAPKQEDKPKPPPITGAHPADAGGAGQPGAKYTREQIAAMRPNCDVLVVSSVSGRTASVVDLAYEAKKMGVHVIAFISMKYATQVEPVHSSGRKLYEMVDLVMDNCSPAAEGMMDVEGIEAPYAAASGIASDYILWSMTSVAVDELLARGITPGILKSANFPGGNDYNKTVIEPHYEKYGW